MSYWDRVRESKMNPDWPDDIREIMRDYENNLSVEIQWITEKLIKKGDPDFDLPMEGTVKIKKRLMPSMITYYHRDKLRSPSILACRRKK